MPAGKTAPSARLIAIATWAAAVAINLSPAASAGANTDAPSSLAEAHDRRLKRAGIGLTLAGVSAEVAAISLWGATVGIVSNRRDEYSSDPPAYWPVLSLALATSIAAPMLLGVGIPLWSVAARRLERTARP